MNKWNQCLDLAFDIKALSKIMLRYAGNDLALGAEHEDILAFFRIIEERSEQMIRVLREIELPLRKIAV